MRWPGKAQKSEQCILHSQSGGNSEEMKVKMRRGQMRQGGRGRASERGRTNGVSSSSAAAGQRAAGAFFGVGAADALTEWLSDRSLGGRVGAGDGGGVWRRANVCIGSMR